jgi:hypothetical protein
VAVSADEDALLGFLPESREGPAHRDCHGKRLLFGIHVMEMEVDDAVVVPADAAAAAGFLDQDPLDLL